MDSLNEAENLEFIWNSEVVEVLADDLVTGVKVKNKENCEVSEIDCDGVFVAIGKCQTQSLSKDRLTSMKEGMWSQTRRHGPIFRECMRLEI